MAKQVTNGATRPTTPAQPNIAKPRAVDGMMPIVDKGSTFARTVSFDAKTHTARAAFLVRVSDKHEWAFAMNTRFVFPAGTPEVAAVWAVRALRVDMQSRFRGAYSNKDEKVRAAAPLAKTWAEVKVEMPDERAPADPEKAKAREKSALLVTIAALRRAGKVAEADMLAKMVG